MSESFTERWRRKERELGFDEFPATLIPSSEWVLPSEAAPCLTFDRTTGPLPLWEVFGPRTSWSAEDRERLVNYRVIGSDGAGNPICLTSDVNEVWLLDHEDGFRTRQFINTGVPQLAECLLAYMGEQDSQRFRAAVD